MLRPVLRLVLSTSRCARRNSADLAQGEARGDEAASHPSGLPAEVERTWPLCLRRIARRDQYAERNPPTHPRKQLGGRRRCSGGGSYGGSSSRAEGRGGAQAGGAREQRELVARLQGFTMVLVFVWMPWEFQQIKFCCMQGNVTSRSPRGLEQLAEHLTESGAVSLAARVLEDA